MLPLHALNAFVTSTSVTLVWWLVTNCRKTRFATSTSGANATSVGSPIDRCVVTNSPAPCRAQRQRSNRRAIGRSCSKPSTTSKLFCPSDWPLQACHASRDLLAPKRTPTHARPRRSTSGRSVASSVDFPAPCGPTICPCQQSAASLSAKNAGVGPAPDSHSIAWGFVQHVANGFELREGEIMLLNRGFGPLLVLCWHEGRYPGGRYVAQAKARFEYLLAATRQEQSQSRAPAYFHN